MSTQESLIHVTDANFEEEIIKSDKPALVDFWATWCGPCRAISPLVEALAETYRDRVKVSKLNVDESPKTASEFGVRSIPTLILFKDGKVVDTLVGVVSKERLEAFVNQSL